MSRGIGSKKFYLICILLLSVIGFGYLSLDSLDNSSLSVIKNEEPIVNSESEVPQPNIKVISSKETESENYFVDYRIEREKVRSQQVEILREIVNNPNSITDVRKEAQEKLLSLTQTLENELKLENLIIAKGYPDAAVFIQPESVMVILKSEAINQEDVTKIADLISNTTGHQYEDIVIISKN